MLILYKEWHYGKCYNWRRLEGTTLTEASQIHKGRYYSVASVTARTGRLWSWEQDRVCWGLGRENEAVAQ